MILKSKSDLEPIKELITDTEGRTARSLSLLNVAVLAGHVPNLIETVEALWEENEKLKLELHTEMWCEDNSVKNIERVSPYDASQGGAKVLKGKV